MAFRDKSELSSYPLTLTHGERRPSIFVAFAVKTVAEAALTVPDRHAQIEVKIDGRTIWNGIALRRWQCGEGLLNLCTFLVGTHAGVSLEQEVVALTIDNKGGIVTSHHDKTSILMITFRGKAHLGCGCESRSCRFLQEQVGHLPKGAEVLWQVIGIETVGAIGRRHTVKLVVVGMPLPLEAQLPVVELVGLLGVARRRNGGNGGWGGLWLAVRGVGLAVIAHDGPAR